MVKFDNNKPIFITILRDKIYNRQGPSFYVERFY